MLFFRSEEHLDRWLTQRDGARGGVLSLMEAWALAALWYTDRRQASWRPRTISESQSIFTQSGLVSDFWSLEPRP